MPLVFMVLGGDDSLSAGPALGPVEAEVGRRLWKAFGLVGPGEEPSPIYDVFLLPEHFLYISAKRTSI